MRWPSEMRQAATWHAWPREEYQSVFRFQSFSISFHVEYLMHKLNPPPGNVRNAVCVHVRCVLYAHIGWQRQQRQHADSSNLWISKTISHRRGVSYCYSAKYGPIIRSACFIIFQTHFEIILCTPYTNIMCRTSAQFANMTQNWKIKFKIHIHLVASFAIPSGTQSTHLFVTVLNHMLSLSTFQIICALLFGTTPSRVVGNRWQSVEQNIGSWTNCMCVCACGTEECALQRRSAVVSHHNQSNFVSLYRNTMPMISI